MGGREDGDGIYVVPEELLKNVDCCMSYGIADDISFEDQFSLKYKRFLVQIQLLICNSKF